MAFCIYVLGVIVESRLQHSVHNIISNVMQRIPLIGYIYDMAKRLIAIVERKDDGTFQRHAAGLVLLRRRRRRGGAGTAAVAPRR